MKVFSQSINKKFNCVGIMNAQRTTERNIRVAFIGNNKRGFVYQNSNRRERFSACNK